jgi:ABC-type Fe3+/spermidine/putrescine transport system ATPase subunit
MRQGRLEQLGTPQQLYREPASVSVRDFVGRTIVLSGSVDAREDGDVCVRLSGSDVLQCRGGAPEALRVGDRVEVAVRPEQVHVDVDTESDTQNPSNPSNQLKGRIEALLFIGDHYEATLALEIGQTVMAHLPAVDRWHEGQPIRLWLRPEDVRVWEDVKVNAS